MQKNDIIFAECQAVGSGGEGIVRYEGATLFVPFLLTGERAYVRILKIKGNVGYGKIVELLAPAEDRVRPKCEVFEKCGGCQLQHMKYRLQLKFKSNLLADTLRKIGGVTYPVPACVKSDKEYEYRNKLQLPIGFQNDKNAVGFYAERSHRIVPTKNCPIHPAWSEGVIDAVYRFMEKCGLDGYNEATGEGQLRHIVVRELKGKFIVTLVTTTEVINGIDYFLFLLDGLLGEYTFYLNVNAKQTNVILGEKFILLKGNGFFECTEGGIAFEAGANTFIQVNENVRGKLYEQAVALMEGANTVIDCYAGGGLLTAMLAKRYGKAYGVEIVPEASACADKLRDKNGLQKKMYNICGKVEDVLPDLIAKEGNAAVLLDPPRAGLDRSVIRTLEQNKVQKIVMISCNPSTLARDLGLLTGSLTENERGELLKAQEVNGNYEITYLQPFDMFPQTKHLETLVCLERK